MTYRKFDTGMYIVDRNYKIVNYNKAMEELYPDVKIGDICYRSVALRDTPCEVCPLNMDNALFYNPIRKEWIYANAAAMFYPEHGECFTVQFQLRQRIGDVGQESLREENMDEHIKDLSEGRLDVCVIGGYCEPGFPLFYVNGHMLELLGYESIEEMYSVADGLVLNTIHPDDIGRVTKDLTKCAQHGGNFEITYRIHRKDNTWFWIVARGKRVETRDGEFALLCVITDMSDFMRRQSTLRDENEMLLKKELASKAVLEHMPGGYHRCMDREGFPFIYFGKSFEEITGWSREEIEKDFGNLFINLVLPEDIPICAGIIDNIATNGYSNDIYRIKRKGGGYRWVSDSTMRIDIGDEHFYHGILADVTDYVEGIERQKEELAEARRIAEDSSRSKSTFLFNVSHDIRTPMNAIQGFAHMIGENADDADFVRRTVGKINESSRVLLQLLNDVLELSRIESGKDKLETKAEDIKEIIEKLELMFGAEIRENGVYFNIETDLTHPCVMCDELKCTRVLMNMLSNAKKFTPSGGSITLKAEELEFDGERAKYRFTVSDTGIGMSDEFKAKAFEEFERARTSTDSGKTGSGLGLAIIKKLVNLMGGEYFLESAQGKGTDISVILSFKVADSAYKNEEKFSVSDYDFTGYRMLIAEDNDFNREIAEYIFSEVGFEVETAENGKNCLDKLFSAERGYYDIILMDIQMPVLDGFVATHEIRRHPDISFSSIPIIAMTANAFEEDRQRCLKAGMNGHIGKPFESKAVVRELIRVLGIK